MKFLVLFLICACNREVRERRDEVRRLLPEARQLADSLDAARRAGMVAALSAARTDLGPCPIEARFPIGERNQEVVRRIAPLVGSPLVPLYLLGADVVPTREPGASPGPRRKYADGDLKKAEEALTNDALLEGKDGEALLEGLRRVATRPFWKPDLTLAADLYVAPERLNDDQHFNGGLVVGRAYLWSYDEGAVVCSGTSGAQSSGEVKVGTLRVNGSPIANFDLGEIQRDVKFNALQKALPELRRSR
jgi:hypothetical protein